MSDLLRTGSRHRARPQHFALLTLIVAAGLAQPVFAQVDLTGAWAPIRHEDVMERGPGPALVDYAGLPINDQARKWALAWDPNRLGLQEHQCQVHTVAYIHRGPLRLRIWEERDPQTQEVVAIRMYSSTYEQNRTIWMDGRPHPPEYAKHTWMGFSTGEWQGDTLTVYTTHVKQGWHRRNGLPSSDLLTVTEHFILHDNVFTHVSIATDPVYLTEPLVKSEEYEKGDSDRSWLWPCEYVNELPGSDPTKVQSWLPGENPYLTEFADYWKIPLEAALGGPETMYPEYQQTVQELQNR